MNKKNLNTITTQYFFYLLIPVFLLSYVSDGHSQSFDGEFGARSKGIGNSNTTLLDEWAIFNNVAGISGVENGSVVFGYDRFFNIEGFDKAALALIKPINVGSSVFLPFI